MFKPFIAADIPSIPEMLFHELSRLLPALLLLLLIWAAAVAVIIVLYKKRQKKNGGRQQPGSAPRQGSGPPYLNAEQPRKPEQGSEPGGKDDQRP